MAATVTENLILDLLESVANREKTYEEVLDAWRTSCPKLPAWERRQRSPTSRHKESKRPPHRHHHAPRPRPSQAAPTIFNFRSSQPGEKKRTKRRAQQRGNLKSFAAETKRAPAKIASALNPTQFDAYLRDHLLLDKSVDET